MIRRTGSALAFILLLAAWRVSAQQQPAAQPTPQQQQQQQIEQQRQEAQRQAAEELRKQQEAERERIMQSILPSAPASLAKTAPVQVPEPCLSMETPRDQGFNLKEIPLDNWLAGPETREIPWKVQVRSPELRLDQRYQVGYSGRIDSNDLKWSTGNQELRFVSGVTAPDGRALVMPKSGTRPFKDLPRGRFSVLVSDCVFLQPGDYVIWMAVYDINSKKHNVFKKSIHVPEWPVGILPDLKNGQTPVEFPEVVGREQRNLQAFPGAVSLPLKNKQAVKLDVISILSPADQWSARADIVRAVNNRVLSATGIISQIRPAAGSVSTTALDLTNRSTVFEQREFRQLNWPDLEAVFIRSKDAFQVGVPALEGLKDHGKFFRETLRTRLDARRAPKLVFVIVSGSLLFAEGSDVKPLNVEGDCNCRFYHIRLRLNKDDVFDDLGKLIKPFHPTTFDIMNARDFRKALAEIVEDLDRL
jgi:hypothetical protein